MWKYTFQVTLEDDSIHTYKITAASYWMAWFVLSHAPMLPDKIATIKDVKIIDIQAVS